jgi:hypothetical protein
LIFGLRLLPLSYFGEAVFDLILGEGLSEGWSVLDGICFFEEIDGDGIGFSFVFVDWFVGLLAKWRRGGLNWG